MPQRLDDDLIGRSRFVTAWHRRFEWDDESTWPYFANRLDWLAERFDSPATVAADWDWSMLRPAEIRQMALAVIAAFPEPPERFVPRLWSLRGDFKR